MNNIEYLALEHMEPNKLMTIVNEDSVRTHLVHHPYFDANSIQTWLNDKMRIDALPGCKVRGVAINGDLAGWCGIQPDDNGVEIAIVISKKFWGSGIAIFKTLMHWAQELNHNEVLFHLLDSRREYKALAKIATKVHHTELLGRRFTTYCFPVEPKENNDV